MDPYYDFERPVAELEKKILDLQSLASNESVDFSKEIRSLQKKLKVLTTEIYETLTPWQRVQLSRHPNRPYSQDYINEIFADFFELHGDRKYKDDPAILGGCAYFHGQPVMIIGQQKGRGTKEKVFRNFGMAQPEGYRKALRLMELANRFDMPIITLIDTPGAFPGIDAEERGQSEAIADNILKMFSFTVPIISVVIGEGGSGGALALAVADHVMMMEYSTYSVISPESCASILWSDSSQCVSAANVLRLSAPDVKDLGVIEEIVEEPKGGAHKDHKLAAEKLKAALDVNLKKLSKISKEDLKKNRHERFRKIGQSSIISNNLEA